MYTKVWAVVLIFIFMASLTGCIGVSEPQNSTYETGIPVRFTRISDGIQISLGMTQEQIEQKLGSGKLGYPFANHYVYDDISVLFRDDAVSVIFMECLNWSIAGISVGNDIQKVFDTFGDVTIFDSANEVDNLNDIENLDNARILVTRGTENIIFSTIFTINEHREIETITLGW